MNKMNPNVIEFLNDPTVKNSPITNTLIAKIFNPFTFFFIFRLGEDEEDPEVILSNTSGVIEVEWRPVNMRFATLNIRNAFNGHTVEEVITRGSLNNNIFTTGGRSLNWTRHDVSNYYIYERLAEFNVPITSEINLFMGHPSKFRVYKNRRIPPSPKPIRGGGSDWIAGLQGKGYSDWIANLQAIQSGNGFVRGVPTPEYYIGDVPPQEGEGYYEWQRNLAKLSGGAYESVLADHGNEIIERLFLMKAHNLYLMTIITNSNNIGLYFDGQPTLFVEARSVNNFNSQNKIEIPLKSKPLTLRKFMTKHSKPDDRFRNSYEYMFDRLFSNDLISNSDISDFLALPKPYYEGYDPNPEPSELERPD